jgi:hypothetical protein
MMPAWPVNSGSGARSSVDRALASGARGRVFESRRARSDSWLYSAVLGLVAGLGLGRLGAGSRLIDTHRHKLGHGAKPTR